ncbi:MAG: pseudouridine synthase [Planctomycetota bacterium]|jgi:pseudouridine synthase
MDAGHAFTDAGRGPRLQKVLAMAGVGSRRACEELIVEGEVEVNGRRVTSLPAWVDPDRDEIRVHGRPVRLRAPREYILLFKPRGVVCTSSDPQGRRRAIDLVETASKTRLYTVGRLDLDSSGLLLLTNDGELAHRLTHPRFGVHKEYDVTVRGMLDDRAVSRLERGLFLTRREGRDAGRTARSRVRVVRRDRDRTHLRLELHEGRNRQIRRMMARIGHPVKKLRRVRLGPLRLAGLRPGQWRHLQPRELTMLRKACRGPRQSAGRGAGGGSG